MFYLAVLSGHTCMAVRDRIVGAMANSLATYIVTIKETMLSLACVNAK